MNRKTLLSSTVRTACACTAGLAAFLAASAALGQDSPNAVRDPGFEGGLGSKGAWIKEVYEAPNNTNQCGGRPVCTSNKSHQGAAQLNPLYFSTQSPTCFDYYPCVEKGGIGIALVLLKQLNLDPGAGDFVEMSFDFRLIDRRADIDCMTGCFDEFPAAEAALVELGGVSRYLTITFDANTGDGGWQRARIGFRRAFTDSLFEIRFKLLASVETDRAPDAYGASLEVDNVVVTSFDGACSVDAWSCPTPVDTEFCEPWQAPFYQTVELPFDVGLSAADPEEPFACDRPCGPACQGDVNGDGVVSGADLGAMLGVFGTSDPAADLNGDGVVSGADLGILLGDWGCGS